MPLCYAKNHCQEDTIKIADTRDVARLEDVPLEKRLDGLQSTYDVILRAARNTPEKIALHFLRSGDTTEQAVDISYARLGSRVTQTANLFHDLGIGSCDVVSYILPNLPETHYVLWGAEAAGVVNPINPMLDLDHMAGIMNAAQSKILVIAESMPDMKIWQKIKNRVPTLKHIIQLGGRPADDSGTDVIYYEEIIDNYSGSQLDSGRLIRRDEVCSLFHTGGTTGTPKLARHSHYNEISSSVMTGLSMDLSSEDIGFCGLPMFHVNGPILTGLTCFMEGTTVVLATPEGYRSPDVIPNFWKIVEKYRVTFFSGVPTIYTSLLNVPIGDRDVSSLRMALCGAAPMPCDVIDKFEAVTGLVLVEGYGMTEGTCVSSCNPLGGERRVGSIGIRIPYQEMKTVILDEDGRYLRDCNTDEIGTVAVRGPNIFDGYLQEEANKEIWIAEGWYNSGDMGREDAQGYFWLTGRTKELIIRGGHNIDPAVIENALTPHEDVMAVAAVGKPDSYAGEVPVAYVVLHQGADCKTSELIDFARKHITERAAVPKEIYLIDALPLTAVGKIFKPDLKRDAIKREIINSLAEFNLKPNISVEADKTYGTVAKVSNVPEEKIADIKDILGQYAFHTIINN